ncbi:MAG: 3-deoxy-manno-octulosonate cytidylyltransferase [Elusimicrobiota bacterium]
MLSDDAVIIIPARYASVRFPAKALAMIEGKSLIERVWSTASRVKGVQGVWIATDHDKIAHHCHRFTPNVIMTDPGCANGTERVYQALGKLGQSYGICINFQGDAPLTPPWVIEALLARFAADKDCQMVTPATLLSSEETAQVVASGKGAAGTVFVTIDAQGKALYFSRSVIPNPFRLPAREMHFYRHIGIYAYRRPALQKWVALPESQLERSEGLEQLRVLEAGMPMHVALVDYRGRPEWAVDVPGDVEVVSGHLQRFGEP